MLTIVADENIPRVAEFFGGLGNVTTIPGRALGREDLTRADILLVRSVTVVNEALLAGTPVQFVGSATSGTDHIDLQYLSSAGIAFAAAPGANANSVVEYVLAAVAAVDGALEKLLAGGRLGIVGYGNVGRLLERRLDAVGIQSCVTDPWLDISDLPHNASLEEVLASDVVSLHAELTDEHPWPSRHLLGPEQLHQMKPGGLLINASRGAVVDNAALLHVLEQRKALTAVLDVWEGEPDVDPQLLQCVALGTAHIAGYSYDGKLRGTQMLLAACASHLSVQVNTAGNDIPQTEPLSLDAPLDTAASLRSLIQQRYDIFRDDALLRDAVGPQRGQANARAFDRLRREYRQRRELAGSTVRLDRPGDEQLAVLKALDCTALIGE